MADGSYAEYDYLSYTGTFDPRTGVITVTPTSIISLGRERQTNLHTTEPGDVTQKATVRVQSGSGVVMTVPSATAADNLYERESTTLIGEAASVAVDPPEAYLTVTPVAGEAILINGTDTSTGTPRAWQVQYRTIAVNVTYDGFPNATVTTLTEAPGTAHEVAYQWVFSGGEIAEEILGQVNPDNTISAGSMLRRIGVGHNP